MKRVLHNTTAERGPRICWLHIGKGMLAETGNLWNADHRYCNSYKVKEDYTRRYQGKLAFEKVLKVLDDKRIKIRDVLNDPVKYKVMTEAEWNEI